MTAKPVGRMKDLADVKRSRGVLVPELQKVALSTAGPDPERRTDVLHPSEMAKDDWCHRASYFRIATGKLPDPEPFKFQMESIFDEGNIQHEKWQRRMRQTKKLWGDWRCMICKQWARAQFEPSPVAGKCIVTGVIHFWEYKEVSLFSGIVAGHEDGALDDYLVELKTIGLGTVRHDAPDFLKLYYKELAEGGRVYDYDKLWADLSRPFISHVRQANIYLWLAREMGLPFGKVRFLYEFKANQAVKEFSVVLSERIMKPILTGIRAVEYALEHGEPPECPRGGCKACQFYEEQGNAGQKDKAGRARRVTRDPAPERRSDPPGGRRGTGGDGGTVPARRVVRRRGRAEDAGDRTGAVGAASGEGAPRDPGRRDRAGRPSADAAVHEPVEVDAVPGGSARGGPGRRVVRRKTGRDRQGG